MSTTKKSDNNAVPLEGGEGERGNNNAHFNISNSLLRTGSPSCFLCPSFSHTQTDFSEVLIDLTTPLSSMPLSTCCLVKSTALCPTIASRAAIHKVSGCSLVDPSKLGATPRIAHELAINTIQRELTSPALNVYIPCRPTQNSRQRQFHCPRQDE